MRYPHDLPENGTVGFIAPSFGAFIEPYHSAFLNALDVLEEAGFQLKLGPNCFEGSGIGISNTPEACGAEANDFFTDPEVDTIISCGGGELMCTTLDYVDFDRIREAEPKWFMGFSDNTNFCFLLPTLCDTAAVYGPCAPAFGMEPWHPVLTDALGLLTGEIDEVGTYGMWEIEGLKDEEHPLLPYNTTEETVLVKYPEELEETEIYMSGRLLGGNMDLLTVLAGTCYDKVEDFQKRYPDDGIIWFLESCDLSVFDMRRALWHMEHCGWFKTTKGFIIGRPLHYGEEMMGMNQYNAVIEILKKYDVPVIMDADLGHLPPSMPMIVGAKVEVFCEGNDLRIRFIRE